MLPVEYILNYEITKTIWPSNRRNDDNLESRHFLPVSLVSYLGVPRPHGPHAPLPRRPGDRLSALRQHIQQEVHSQPAHRTGEGGGDAS